MLNNIQVLAENGQAKVAVISFAACEELRVLLADAEELADSLDDLHVQKVKAPQPACLKLAEVKVALALN